jgi:hypothetical protein
MGKNISIYVNLLMKWFIISSLSIPTQTIARTWFTVSETISREAKTKNRDYRFFREAIENSGKSTILASIDGHDFVVGLDMHICMIILAAGSTKDSPRKSFLLRQDSLLACSSCVPKGRVNACRCTAFPKRHRLLHLFRFSRSLLSPQDIPAPNLAEGVVLVLEPPSLLQLLSHLKVKH